MRDMNGLTRESLDEREAMMIDRARREPGTWIATATGGVWFFMEPDARDVDVISVAFGLGRRARYSGQFDPEIDFYSVAEHSCIMTEYARCNMPDMRMEDCLSVLLHDASEFALPDFVTPMKELIRPIWDPIEKATGAAISAAFIADPEAVRIGKRAIKELDVRVRADERASIILEPASTAGRGHDRLPWIDGDVPRLGVRIEGLAPRLAANAFLEDLVRIVEDVPCRSAGNAPENNPLLARSMERARAFLGRGAAPSDPS